MFRRHLLLTASALVCCVVPTVGFAQTQPDDHYFSSDGARIRFVDVGVGEPLVLIHGFGGSIDYWISAGTVNTLSKEFRVIAMDCRGHGKSDKPHDPKRYGIRMVTDVASLLEHLRLPKAHIVGYSMGGSLTVKFITLYPDRVITATIGGSSGVRGWTAQSEQNAVQVATSLEQGKGMRPLILQLWATDEPKPSEDVIERRSREWLAPDNDALALAAVMRGYHEWAVTDEQLKAARAPLLAVVGTVDPRLAGVSALKALLPSLEVVTIEGASHLTADERGTLRRPEFANAVRDFIAAHRSRSP